MTFSKANSRHRRYPFPPPSATVVVNQNRKTRGITSVGEGNERERNRPIESLLFLESRVHRVSVAAIDMLIVQGYNTYRVQCRRRNSARDSAVRRIRRSKRYPSPYAHVRVTGAYGVSCSPSRNPRSAANPPQLRGVAEEFASAGTTLARYRRNFHGTRRMPPGTERRANAFHLRNTRASLAIAKCFSRSADVQKERRDIHKHTRTRLRAAGGRGDVRTQQA